jgi:hypothetical protein
MRIRLLNILAVGCLLAPAVASTSTLSDITVFSANGEGENWNSLIWNTQGEDTDQPAPGRFNLYLSEHPLSDTSPPFLNGFNDARVRISESLATGVHTFSIYGEGVGIAFNPLQHFVINLYFDSDQTSPAISGVQNLSGDNLAPAGHPNGLDIFGNSGHPEAGTLSVVIGDKLITLTDFAWITDGQRDVVWPYWANDPIYSNGSGQLDYYGTFTVTVEEINRPPNCDEAVASLPIIWPPNHKFVAVQLLGITDPDGDPVTITISGITQDEPVDGRGDGSFAPDADGVGSSVASLRAERAGGGDGRVYTIDFEAVDPNGGVCASSVDVAVPHDLGEPVGNQGSLYDSTYAAP